MSAKLGRNARLLKDGQAIGYGKNISVKAALQIELIGALSSRLAGIYL